MMTIPTPTAEDLLRLATAPIAAWATINASRNKVARRVGGKVSDSIWAQTHMTTQMNVETTTYRASCNSVERGLDAAMYGEPRV